MLSVEQAFDRIVGKTPVLSTEKRAVDTASGFVLAGPLNARLSQPAKPLSAMDGYAVDSKLLTGEVQKFPLHGVSAAGASPEVLTSGSAMRIYTGAIVPEGADQIIIQENVTIDANNIIVQENPNPMRHIREAGIDFTAKQCVLEAGTYFTPKSIGLAAAAGYGHVMVHRAAKVAILACGDELVNPDQKTFEAHHTVNSNIPLLSSYFKGLQANVTILGTTKDDRAELVNYLKSASNFDILITIGGASVGDRDMMQDCLKQSGMLLDFWKVAMRPGKPLIYGKIGKTQVLGLPGNPVSAFVCAMMFAGPLIDKMMGRPAPLPVGVPLPSATDLPENGPRYHLMRARLIGNPGERHVDVAGSQDSSLLSVLSQCDGLVVRPANASPVKAGEMVQFLPF